MQRLDGTRKQGRRGLLALHQFMDVARKSIG